MECIVHQIYIPPALGEFTTFQLRTKALADDVGKKSEGKSFGPGVKRAYAAIGKRFGEAFDNFTCERCGESFGDVATWGTDRVLFIDSLSGMSKIIMNLVAGDIATKTLPNWANAMEHQMVLITEMVQGAKCHFIMIGHPDKLVDAVHGGVRIQPSALGNKNSPQIPTMFHDVIWAHMKGKKYLWSTIDAQADLKHQFLESSNELPPDFTPLFKAWKARSEFMPLDGAKILLYGDAGKGKTHALGTLPKSFEPGKIFAIFTESGQPTLAKSLSLNLASQPR